jgi:hypothetical protein
VSGDGTVREWDPYQGSTERLLALGGRRAIALAVSPDARYVVCVTSSEPFLLIYDARTGNLLRTIGPITAPARALAVTSQGGTVVALFDDAALRCYDLHTGALVRVIAAPQAQVHAVGVSDDGSEAVTVCADGVLRRYNVGTGALVTEIDIGGSTHASAVVLVGAVAVTGGEDGTISRWDLSDATRRMSSGVSTAAVQTLAAKPDGELILVLRGDGSIRLHDLIDGAVVADLTAQLGAAPVRAPAAARSAPPSPTAPVLDEDVQFTVYRPARLPVAQWTSMLVFAHKSDLMMDPESGVIDPVEEVEARARAHFRGIATRASRSDSATALTRGGQLHIVPELPGIRCVPLAADVIWWEPVHEAQFQLYAPPELGKSVVRGWVRIWCGPLILGELAVTLPVVRDPGHAATPAGLTGQPLVLRRKIFPSYSHDDSRMVAPFALAAHVIGDQYLQDVLALRSGERWHDRLLEFIEGADVFQLFWSSNSMRSDHCRREWEHALALNRQQFVCPVYWEEPFPRAPGLPSEALGALHFARIPAADLAPPVPDRAGRHAGFQAPGQPELASPVPAGAATATLGPRGPVKKPVHWLLGVSPGPTRGRRVPVSRDRFLVGQAATSDLVLGDPRVSRVHAALQQRGDELYVEDLGSTSGTAINGIPVTAPRRLRHGDLVAFATVRLRYQKSDQPSDERIGRTAEQPALYIPGAGMAGNVGNVGRDEIKSYAPYTRGAPGPPSPGGMGTKRRARRLVLPGLLLLALGFIGYGVTASRYGLIALAAGLLGLILLIAGIVRYTAARAKRRRADRKRPPGGKR